MKTIKLLIITIIAALMILKLNIYWDKDLLEPSTKPYRNVLILALDKKLSLRK
jgi:hypothetical protein